MSAALSEAASVRENVPVAWPRAAGACEDYPAPEDAEAFRAYFEREGFIVVRGRLGAGLCEAAVRAFRQEVLPDRHGWFERHASGRHEHHVYTDSGFMQYPIMNLQDMPARRYPDFRRHGLDLLTQPAIQSAMRVLCGEPGRVIHTMYFDANQTTWAHRDGHYIDSHQPGSMIGVWVAAEDIDPGAGRFYVVPRSHRIAVPGEHDDPNGGDYKARMAEFVRHGPLECVAPIMKRGDFLLWTSLTIHGSLPTASPHCARRSFTAHYVPASHNFHWSMHGGASRRSLCINGVDIIQHRGTTLGARLRDAVRDQLPRTYGFLQATKQRMTAGGNGKPLP